MALAWYVIEFLSIYRKNPKIIAFRKVRLGGTLPKSKRIPSEWYVMNDRIFTELLPPADTPLDGAIKPIKLIPPSERPEELVAQTGTHQSPKEHWVKKHTKVYWTGKGRKIPVVKEIKPYKRGEPSESGETPGATRIYE